MLAIKCASNKRLWQNVLIKMGSKQDKKRKNKKVKRDKTETRQTKQKMLAQNASRPHGSTTSANAAAGQTGCVGDSNNNNNRTTAQQQQQQQQIATHICVSFAVFDIIPYKLCSASAGAARCPLPSVPLLSHSLFALSLFELRCLGLSRAFGCTFSLIFVSRRIHKNSLKAVDRLVNEIYYCHRFTCCFLAFALLLRRFASYTHTQTRL